MINFDTWGVLKIQKSSGGNYGINNSQLWWPLIICEVHVIHFHITRLTRGGAAGRRPIVSRSHWVIWHRSYTPNLSKSLLNSKRILEFLMLLVLLGTWFDHHHMMESCPGTFFSDEKHHNNSQKILWVHPTARSLAFLIRARGFWALRYVISDWHDQNQRRPVLWKPAFGRDKDIFSESFRVFRMQLVKK